MFRQILKTKEVPEKDITEMIAGRILYLQEAGANFFIEYKKLDLEKDEDGEERGEIYYAGAGSVYTV